MALNLKLVHKSWIRSRSTGLTRNKQVEREHLGSNCYDIGKIYCNTSRDDCVFWILRNKWRDHHQYDVSFRVSYIEFKVGAIPVCSANTLW